MRLQLTRPLAFPDLETTGKDAATAEIVEICIIKVYPDRKRQMYHTLVKPRNPIPPDATAVHGICDADVKDAPYIEEIIDEIYDFFADADIAGYNSNAYDIPILSRVMDTNGFEFPKPGVSLIDACVIFKRKEGRTLKDANVFYMGEVLEDAHAATADVMATINVLFAQVDKYTDLPTNVKDLAIYSNYDKVSLLDREGKFGFSGDGYPIFTFGKKCIGQRCKDNHNYLDWMISSESFSTSVKSIAKRIKNGEFDPKVVGID